MFEDAVVESRGSGGKKSTVFVSTAVHAFVVGLLLIAPMLVTEVLPANGWGDGIMLMPGDAGLTGGGSAPPPPPLRFGSADARPTTSSTEMELVTSIIPTVDVVVPADVVDTSNVESPTIVLPVAVPSRVARMAEVEFGDPLGVLGGQLDGQQGGVLGGVPGGVPGGLVGGTGLGLGPGNGLGFGPGFGPGSGRAGFGGGKVPPAPPVRRLEDRSDRSIMVPQAPSVPIVQIAAAALPSTPVVPPPPAAPKVVKLSSISRANLIYGPSPVYPELARTTRVEGTVKVEARINRDGLIIRETLRVVSGNALLRDAAVEAIRQWRYKPMILNGEKVEVETFVEVNFVLR